MENLIEFLLRDGIKFVVMTPRTTHGQCHPYLASCYYPVHDILSTVFLVNDSPLDRDAVVPVEARGKSLMFAGLWQEITGQLLNGKFIERLITVIGINHPVTPHPLLPLSIILVPVGVSISSEVQPMSGHMFTVCR